MSSKILAKLPELLPYASRCQTYEDLNEFSLKRPDLFWGSIARARIDWIQDFKQVCNTASLDRLLEPGFRIKWFTGGKLNVTGMPWI
jgi:hypothetical protein